MRLAGLIAVTMWSAMALPVAQAQNAGFTPRTDGGQIPSYELVSIHKSPDRDTPWSIHDDPDGLTATSARLKWLIAEAYGFSLGQLNDDQLVGAPEWVKTQQFDIRAKVDPANVEKLKELDKAATMMFEARAMASRTPTFRMVMLQRLLEDRFKLKVHYEQRVVPLYEMTVAKGGVRMPMAHPKDPEHGSMDMDPGKLKGDNVPMSFIPVMFALVLERPVADKTSTSGNFDFSLHWTPMDAAKDSGAEDAGPSLFTAVQEQMGLKLQAGKGPVWVIVVDHTEMPSEN